MQEDNDGTKRFVGSQYTECARRKAAEPRRRTSRRLTVNGISRNRTNGCEKCERKTPMTTKHPSANCNGTFVVICRWPTLPAFRGQMVHEICVVSLVGHSPSSPRFAGVIEGAWSKFDQQFLEDRGNEP